MVHVVLPSRLAHLSDREQRLLRGLTPLLREHAESLRVELGAPFEFANEPPPSGPCWLIGPVSCNPALAATHRPSADPPGALAAPIAPVVPIAHAAPAPPHPILHVDRAAGILISDAPTVDGIFESFSLLKTMHWDESRTLTSQDCTNVDEAVQRIAHEVATTWPSFERTGIDWHTLCERYAREAAAAAEPVAVMERWLAELGDAHTGVRPTTSSVAPSFRARVEDDLLVLHEVPQASAAWDAGAREGDVLLELDGPERWPQVGAAVHHRPFLVALRATSGLPGAQRRFSARSPSGRVSAWTEAYALLPGEPDVSWRRLSSGTGYLRVRRWLASAEHEGAVDTAFEALRGAPGLVVDLRGNGGGNVAVARAFRDRFVRERTLMGFRQFTDPRGRLGARAAITAEPAVAENRWAGPVRFLTDPLTYSASEDLLLGLQGLAHVEVVGLPSGGGSGQARVVRLLPGFRLMVGSCLTFDREGRCIEGAGIAVDRRVELPASGEGHLSSAGARGGTWEESLLATADRGW